MGCRKRKREAAYPLVNAQLEKPEAFNPRAFINDGRKVSLIAEVFGDIEQTQYILGQLGVANIKATVNTMKFVSLAL